MAVISEWLEAHLRLIELLSFCSLILLVVTLAAVPVVVMVLPTDYFSTRRRKPVRRSVHHHLLYAGFVIVKNLLGIVIIITGLALLFLPGQGIITILIGFTLMNFPGKFAVERWIARQPKVRRLLNWIRAKVGKPAFVIPGHTRDCGQ